MLCELLSKWNIDPIDHLKNSKRLLRPMNPKF